MARRRKTGATVPDEQAKAQRRRILLDVVASLRQARRGIRLKGLSLRDLIDDGRR